MERRAGVKRRTNEGYPGIASMTFSSDDEHLFSGSRILLTQPYLESFLHKSRQPGVCEVT